MRFSSSGSNKKLRESSLSSTVLPCYPKLKPPTMAAKVQSFQWLQRQVLPKMSAVRLPKLNPPATSSFFVMLKAHSISCMPPCQNKSDTPSRFMHHERNDREDFVCCLHRFCVWQFKWADECLAAIAGTYPGGNMAGGRAEYADGPGAGVCYE